jgi:ABC-type transport system involved in multi-copper enzyme maturation permease subunit
MVGPVLHQELLLGSRRNRTHVFRWAYAAWLIVLVLYGYARFEGEQQRLRLAKYNATTWPPPALAEPRRASAPEIVGAWFAEAFVVQQLLLIALATPALVAGAVTDEKRRGTLQYLMTADLDDRHIILGKVLARSAGVALLALTGLPLFALLAGFGGVSPVTVLAAGVVVVLPLFALASVAVLASVWCRQTRDAVVAVYVLGTLAGLVVWRMGGVLDYFNPLYVLAPAWGPWRSLDLAEVGRRLLGSTVCWGLLGCTCLGLAIWRLRPVYLKELEGVKQAKRTWYSAVRVPVDDEPIRWRERHVEGLAPTPGLRRIPLWVGVTAVALVTSVSSLLILALSLPANATPGDFFRALVQLRPARLAALLPDAGLGFLVQSLVVMLLASLVVGIRCSGAITGERERHTWEALLLTPISARQLLHGKLWGIMGSSFWYLLAYAAPALLFSALGGLLALLWTVLWLAVTVLAMYYVGAAGLWRSVRARSSWRALLGTLTAGYLGGLAIYLCCSPILFIAAAIVIQILATIDRMWGTRTSGVASNFLLEIVTHPAFFVLSCLGLALIFWGMSRSFLAHALRWIADRERTRHWHEEPIYRRSRRRPRVVAG